MKKRLLCAALCLGFVFSVCACGAKADTPVVITARDSDGNELPVRAMSDDEVEEMINAPTVSLAFEDLYYFFATDESLLDYASTSTPDFRNELAKTAQGATPIEGEEDEYEIFDEPYLEGPTISMEHFADMVDFYKDHGESVALLIYYKWDPFRGEAYERKFEARADSFSRADVTECWGESKDGDDETEITLAEALDKIPAGQYDHLLLFAPASALGEATQPPHGIKARDDFAEVVVFTQDAASLRTCPEAAEVLAEQLGVTPILRPTMAWEVELPEELKQAE